MRNQLAGDPDAGAIWGLRMGLLRGGALRGNSRKFPTPGCELRARLCSHFHEAAGISVLIDMN